jgi:hypothetical protein
MHQKPLLNGKKEVTPANLGEALQQAIEIEIATIPVYLYTYYSINRVPDRDKLITQMTALLVKAGKKPDEAATIALDCAAEIMVYANKAGAVIMSVAVEEMLHMALSSNVKQALAGMPELVGKAPVTWPAYLPGHVPEFPINRAAYSQLQLMTFLKIESPLPIPKNKIAELKAIDYTTIGEFYTMILECIHSHKLKYNTKAPQLIPGRGYYANNNIDTVYYNKQHQPQFSNAGDSGDLIHVVDAKTATKAITEIIHQGEGNKDATPLNPDGTVNCAKATPEDFDDQSKKELTHFEKFARLYCRHEALQKKFTKLGLGHLSDYFVMPVDTNPMTSDYPAPLQAVSTLLNAVYTYIFVMTEECYRKEGNTQYEIFMFGIHKSMIWILDSLCGSMTSMQYIGKDGKTYAAAPTFEFYAFSPASSPKSQIINLFNQAASGASLNPNMKDRISALPDVALEPYQNSSKGPAQYV